MLKSCATFLCLSGLFLGTLLSSGCESPQTKQQSSLSATSAFCRSYNSDGVTCSTVGYREGQIGTPWGNEQFRCVNGCLQLAGSSEDCHKYNRDGRSCQDVGYQEGQTGYPWGDQAGEFLCQSGCLRAADQNIPSNQKQNDLNPYSFVGQHGWLKVSGNHLVDQNNAPVQLRGMSSHGLQYYGHFVNEGAMRYTRDKWGASLFRVAMMTIEGGFINNNSLKYKVIEAADAAIRLGIYVIIDWHILHDNDPLTYKYQAMNFFREMAARYRNNPHVLYEICNEPNQVSWKYNIKPYAEAVIPVIREQSPDSVIIVGTNSWSQDVDEIASAPLPFSNVLYSLHFYANTHTQWLRDKAQRALDNGTPIFVTEWGTSDASGNGYVNISESDRWIDFMNRNGISWANWSLSDKSENSAALNPGSSPWGGWQDWNLSASGKYVSRVMRQ